MNPRRLKVLKAFLLCFGIGTLPALSIVVPMDRFLAHRFRRHGRTFAALALILAGIWLFARALSDAGPMHRPTHHEHTAAG